MLEQKELLLISAECCKLEKKAHELYLHFSEISENNKLKVFWQEIAEDEKEHMKYWAHLMAIIKKQALPLVPNIKETMAKELAENNIKAEKLMTAAGKNSGTQDLFKSAFEIEFLMLHPAFELLFHYTNIYTGEVTPEDKYGEHLSKFVKTASEFNAVSKEAIFMGDMLLAIWDKNKRLAQLSSMDELTGALNRRGIINATKSLGNIAQRNHFNIGIMMIDIDDFKKINDTYGHQTGDKVLQKIVSLIRSNIRDSDIVGRYGGEEFLIFMTNVKEAYLYSLAEKIRTVISSKHGFEFPLTISMGVAQKEIGSEVTLEIDALVKEADTYLYQAKKSGKNRICMRP